ncbi:hypothetical protein BDZ89DRAFT_1124477 [Hymenopellis radicata]|nr:hypothetical protein BDZ89DRAFT_1124477 [Hymenopellis radicata]
MRSKRYSSLRNVRRIDQNATMRRRLYVVSIETRPPGLETSTSHRVTESSGDSTRFGHVGVRTRVTRESHTRESEHESEANGPQRLENETCAIILPDPAIRAESRSDASASDQVGVTIVAPAALTIVRQPMCCCCLCDSSRLEQQLDGRLDGDDDRMVTMTGPRRRLNGANSLTVATAPTQPR